MRVAVADDGVLFRRGLVRLLVEEGVDVVAEVGDADELIRAVESTAPDVVLIDIRMPPTHTVEGLDAAAAIRRSHPRIGVILLSQYVDPNAAVRLLGEGTDGVGLPPERSGDGPSRTCGCDQPRRERRGGH